ncbi:MAG: helix-turn-helix transcriptional regulator [Clostridia bacterium]|nr:helix-turn-helix transcriptional regulator [Clostridia bacterium]
MEEKIKKLGESEINELVSDYKALGDAGRLKIILYLLGGKKSVGEIAKACCSSQSATSHALRILKDARILKAEKNGNVNYYYLADEHVKTIIETSIEHLDC